MEEKAATTQQAGVFRPLLHLVGHGEGYLRNVFSWLDRPELCSKDKLMREGRKPFFAVQKIGIITSNCILDWLSGPPAAMGL